MKQENGQFRLSATDLSNHLSCGHLTQLNRLVASGKIKKPDWHDPSLDVLILRGHEHESAYVKYLESNGLTVSNLYGQSQEATVTAMQQGSDVIVQARLDHENWIGFADILMKVRGQSRFGQWSYEVQDTKLAQDTRAATILQLCLYTDLLSLIQESDPEKMVVVKPGDGFPKEEYRYAEFRAYYRQAKKNFEAVTAGAETSTYPDPVEHCNICRWWQVCDRKRHEDDHLSLVAGIRSLHIVELQSQSIQTLEQFAKATLQKPARGNRETFIRKQQQAKIQLEGRFRNRLLYDLLPSETGRGLNRLPLPDEGDVYFDLEGDPFYQDGGLEYVFGYAFREQGKLSYRRSWATSRSEEKRAFHEFMQFIIDRWKRNSRMYIYHFAPYEPAAVKRLARVHAVFETEVDNLLRGERFIDLHAVFKESLLASVETYSLKELEKLTAYARKVALRDASSARKSTEIALELNNFSAVPQETVRIIEEYNEDDCLATEALHRWLEDLREKLVQSGKEYVRPEVKTGEASEEVQNLDIRSQAIFESLTRSLPEDRSLWNDDHQAHWLLSHLIDYFRREDRSAWWEFFRVHELEHEELLDERKAVTGLEFAMVLPREGKERNPTHRYRYPPQELSIDEGDDLIEVNGVKIGTVRAISAQDHTIDIKKSGNALDVHPRAVHVSERVDPGSLPDSLMDLANAIIDEGLNHAWSRRAAKDLLMRRNPLLADGSDGAYLAPDESAVDGAIRLASHLDQSVLAIQGPPGSGKTHTGARMIIELLQKGKKIGLTAVSHKVIRNLAEATIRQGSERNTSVQFVHKVSDQSDNLPAGIIEVKKSDEARAALNAGKVVCGTAWLWSEKDSAGVLDYLFVDEAGQMSLSHVLAASRAARNIILLGDPQQLEQPQRGSHPEGSDVAALTYLLDGHPTMPGGKGLFLAVTRRLHPSICRFTSEIFYEGRLEPLPGLERQVIGGYTGFDGAGLFYVPVVHKGNQSKSPEEIAVIDGIVGRLLGTGQWTNAEGQTKSLQKSDILIVAPFNAQVSALREQLPGIEIGTVDKFQGQEAPVVIYSMTSSSTEDAPRGMSFLFSPNRLNVATSRARCICILVASPRLLEPECRLIDQMRWANALCRFVELARGQK
ncbi:MAG TPA: TM0106 family RecB-like putative nuclease [Cyclobacteriaceae bacterium]